jgi:5-oxoprolinase (ATP-hydrolysing)
MLGKIRPAYFPQIFGQEGNLPLDAVIVTEKFSQLSQKIGGFSPEQAAAGFITIAVDNMANAIKKISLQRGYDVSEYALCTFGGAGGQVACLIADTLGIKTIFLHPYAGVLSAYGIGLADIRISKESSLEKPLHPDLIPQLQQLMQTLENQARTELDTDNTLPRAKVKQKVSLKYQGTDSTLIVNFVDNVEIMRQDFENQHRQRYGFIQPQKLLIVDSVSVEVIQAMDTPDETLIHRTRPQNESPQPVEIVEIFTQDSWQQTPVYRREDLQPEDVITGTAIIVEKISTIIIEPNWTARLTNQNHLILERYF